MEITFRRRLLDQALCATAFTGKVLDVGGKKDNKRGAFRPPVTTVDSWHYANLDKTSLPDFCCDAENLPIPSSVYDIAVLCEILEHMKSPERGIAEAHRVLKAGGVIILSIPFLFPIHADPYDFQRWTAPKIKSVLESTGFSGIAVSEMGGPGAVIHDLLFIAFSKIRPQIAKRAAKFLLWTSRWMFAALDVVLASGKSSITTGYFVTARKA